MLPLALALLSCTTTALQRTWLNSPMSLEQPGRRHRRITLAEATYAHLRCDEKGSLSEAFAAFQRKPEPKLPGQSGATKGKEGLPIRLGGDVRGGSLGDLRAAVGGFPLDPRNWQAPSRTGDCTAEEAGLVFVFAFTFGAFLWGYLEYVA